MSISVAGSAAIVFGSNKAHDRAVVKAACEAHGWKNIVNRPPSRTTALRDAVNTVARWMDIDAGLPTVLRTLTADVSWEAVRVRKGQLQNETIHLISACLDDETVRLLACHHMADGATLTRELQLAYDARRNLMSPTQLRTVVASVVRRLKGVALGAANLYYLPAAGAVEFARWRDAADLQDRYHSATFSVASDPATVEHIISQLAGEVEAESAAIMQEINDGPSEPRRIKILVKKCRALIDKIRAYEAALGQQLDWMREPLEAAENGLSVSSLLSVAV